MYTTTSSVPRATGNARREQRGRRETNLLGQFPARRCFGRLAAPYAATREVPPDQIRGAHQQECWTHVDRHHGSLMARTRQSPPDEGKGETKAEGSPPGEVEK